MACSSLPPIRYAGTRSEGARLSNSRQSVGFLQHATSAVSSGRLSRNGTTRIHALLGGPDHARANSRGGATGRRRSARWREPMTSRSTGRRSTSESSGRFTRPALLGTDIFNKGKHDECFRLYQGVLTAIHPLLDHRPRLKDFVKEQDRAGEDHEGGRGRVRPARGARRDPERDRPALGLGCQGRSEASPKVAPKKTSLWERLGGEKNVRAIVKDLHEGRGSRQGGELLARRKVQARREGPGHGWNSCSSNSSARCRWTVGVQREKESVEGTRGHEDHRRGVRCVHGNRAEDPREHKVGKAETEELLKHLAATRVVIVEAKEKGM